MTGIWPKKKPAKVNTLIQQIDPKHDIVKKVLYFIWLRPATKGANVLRIGKKRAKNTALLPCFK